VVKRPVEKARLDDLFRGRQFDFVKIDTQGSELDVILGGPVLLSHADYILVEVSLVEYNIGGARAEAVFAKLAELGFHVTEVTDFHRLASVANGNLLQMDFLFERRSRTSRHGLTAAKLDALRHLAQALHREGRREDALLLLDGVEAFQPPGHVETLKQRLKLMAASGRTLEALDALAALKSCAVDLEYLLGEIRDQMPVALERFNQHLAAGELEQAEKYVAALAGLIPGNAAILNSALSCNMALGRKEAIQHYGSALQALQTLQPRPGIAVAAPRKAAAQPRKTRRARKG
jgi:tetratricopeptide (TPR) repeat protein